MILLTDANREAEERYQQELTFADAYPSVRRLAQVSDAKLAALWATCERVADVPGDAAELGVYRGGTGRLLALACPTRTVRLFDTFTGIPWDGFDAATDRHRPGEFPAALGDVREALSDCPNVAYHPGLFPGTAAGERFAVVHLDADLYASTLAGLRWFWPRLSEGGAIVLDDWAWEMCPGVECAVAEFFRGVAYKFEETAPLQRTLWKG